MSNQDIDPHKSLTYLHENIEKYAEAKAHRIYLEEFRKVKKAQEMHIAERANGIKSVAAQEREAYSAQAYIDVLKGLEEAIKKEEILRWRLDTAKIEIEVWRSTNANTRAAT